MTRYTKLFTLEFLHDYYKDNICREITVQPTPETQSWLRQYGCLFRGQLNTWQILSPDVFDLNKIIAENEDFKLEFLCRSGAPSFINLTDFPTDKLGHFYFTNAESNNEQLFLKPEFKPSENTGNIIAEVSIDLSSLIDNNTNGPAYKIEFRARQVPWKYYIIDNSNQNFKSLKLKGEGSELFSGPSEVEIQIGKAQCFDSGENKLPLKEIGDMQLGLVVGKEDGSEIVLINNLPNAYPSSLQMENGELYAANYIYI